MSDSCICYLCGKELGADSTADHVPPKRFYPTAMREAHNPNLLTLQAHRSCNQSYRLDEEYVVHALGVLCEQSSSGSALLADIARQYSHPDERNKTIGKMILKEFERRPSGLVLPPGRILKRFDGERVSRIVWKITRGLFTKEKNRFLPERTPRFFQILLDREPPEEFRHVRDTPSRGQYPEVFDYKYVEFPDLNAHYWAVLLWNTLIMTVLFHDPACSCEKCVPKE